MLIQTERCGMAKVWFRPCWSPYSLYKVRFHKQYFPSTPSPLVPPSLCPCGGWSLRKWPAADTRLKKHVRVHVHVKGRVRNGCKAIFGVMSLYLFGKAKPVLQVQAEVAITWLPLSRRTQAIFLTSNPRFCTACPIAEASEHLTHRIMVEVDVEVRRYLPPFSYIQQSQGHEEGFNLVVQIRHYCLHIYFRNKLDTASLSKTSPIHDFREKITNSFLYSFCMCLKERFPHLSKGHEALITVC